jgi:DNA gyrase subunit A
VLPAAYPNLLVNGAAGIAVGMATNMAPHNLIEVAAAARHLLENPDATLDELMAYVPGPDLPTGGTIVGLDGIRDAYATGRGSFKTRARVSVEQLSARRTGLVVTELPYLVGPEKVIEKIKDGVTSKKITGIADVTDLTDRKHGLRLVIGIKTGFSPEGVLEQLYRLTPLEDGFSINNVALVEGRPRTLGLKELLRVYLDHRISVVTRRSRFRLTRRQERLHLVLGLLIAILDIDEVIQVVRTSDDAAQARTRLMDVFDLSTLQADYILELQLRRLTKFSRIELENERDRLQAEIAELEALLADPARVRSQVAEELDETAERFGTPRRTLLTEAAASIASTPAARKAAAAAGPALEIADVPTLVVLSTTGRAIRVDLPDGTEPPGRPARRNRHDAIQSTVLTTTRGQLGAVTSTGRLLRFSPVDLPAVPANSVQLAAGARIGDYLGIVDKKERVLGLVSLDADLPIALGTAQGVVKRVAPGGYPVRPETAVIALKPGDEVVGVAQGPDSEELVFITTDARLLRFPAASVRPQGLLAGGMAGITLGQNARVLFFTALDAGGDAVVATISSPSATLAGADPGRAKVSRIAEFPGKGRATGGVRAHTFLKGENALALAWAGPAPALAVGGDGSLRTLPDAGAKRDASGTPMDAVVGSIGRTL